MTFFIVKFDLQCSFFIWHVCSLLEFFCVLPVDPSPQHKPSYMGRRQSAPAPSLHKHERRVQPREFEHVTGSSRPRTTALPNGNGNRIVHAQYNSPSALYSSSNVDELFKKCLFKSVRKVTICTGHFSNFKNKPYVHCVGPKHYILCTHLYISDPIPPWQR